MKLLKLPYDQQWIKVAERNYGLRTVTHCDCRLSSFETLVIEGESHDAEPWLSSGTYHCNSCGIGGQWFPASDSGQIVGDTGIATPNILELD
jgi:hypothetical protein